MLFPYNLHFPNGLYWSFHVLVISLVNYLPILYFDSDWGILIYLRYKSPLSDMWFVNTFSQSGLSFHPYSDQSKFLILGFVRQIWGNTSIYLITIWKKLEFLIRHEKLKKCVWWSPSYPLCVCDVLLVVSKTTSPNPKSWRCFLQVL